jgi:RIO kinase 2
MTREDFRLLMAVEMGMRNHEIVPLELIVAIANIRGGGAHKIISELVRNTLIVHEKKMYDGFRLTSAGYDFLALKTLLQRGSLAEVRARWAA